MLKGSYITQTHYVNYAKKHLIQFKQYLVRVKQITQVKKRWVDRPRYFISPNYLKKITQENAIIAANPTLVGLCNGAVTRKRQVEPTEADQPCRPRGRPPASLAPVRTNHGSRNILQMLTALTCQSVETVMVLDNNQPQEIDTSEGGTPSQGDLTNWQNGSIQIDDRWPAPPGKPEAKA